MLVKQRRKNTLAGAGNGSGCLFSLREATDGAVAPGSVRGIKGCRKLGTAQLRSTRRKGQFVSLSTASNRLGQTDELLQSQIGQNSTYVDPNVSMAITRQYNRYIRRPDDIENEPSDMEDEPSDIEGEPSDAETIDSDSSADGDEDSDEEEESANESEDFESENEDLEKEESSEKFVERSSDKNNVTGSWRKRVSLGRKELENENRSDEVGKSGSRSGRINKSGTEPRRVHLKSVREVINKSGREQLMSGKELVNEGGRAQLKIYEATENERVNKSGSVQATENERVNKSGSVQATKNERVNNSGEVQATENERVNKSGNVQTTENERVNNSGEVQATESERVNKSGNVQTTENERVNNSGEVQATENERVNKSGNVQATENENELNKEIGSEYFNKTSRVFIKSNRGWVNEKEKAQLKSGKELVNNSRGEVADKKRGELANKSGGKLAKKKGELAKKKGELADKGGQMANKKGGIQLKSWRELSDETRKDHIDKGGKIQSTIQCGVEQANNKKEQNSKCGAKLAIKNGQGENCAEVTRTDDFLNTSCLDNSISSTLRNLSFLSYQSPKREIKEISVKKCAIIPSDDKPYTIFQNLQSAQNETFVCENTSLSVMKPGHHISSHLCRIRPDRRKPGPALLKKKTLPDWGNLQDNDSVNMDTTYVKADSLSLSSKFQDPGSESQAQIDSNSQKSVNGMQKRASTSFFMNLQTDDSVNMNVTYNRRGLFNMSNTNKDPVSELELSPSSGTGRFGDLSLRTRSATAGRTLQLDHSSTERFGDVSPRTRSATAGRTLQLDHSSSGRKMPTNRKSENDQKIYLSAFPSLEKIDCSSNMDCSVNVDDSVNMDTTYVKSDSLSISGKLEDPGSESQAQIDSGRQKSVNGMQKRASTSSFMNLQTDDSVNMNVTYDRHGLFNMSNTNKDPVSELELSPNSGTGRFGDVSPRTRSATASCTLQLDHSSTERFGDVSLRTRSATAGRTLQLDHSSTERFLDVSPRTRSATAGRTLQLDHLSTERFGDVSPRARSATASRTLQLDHSSSGKKMPTNRKSENDQKISLSHFPSLQKTGLFEASFRHESPVCERQVPSSSDIGRYEKSVSELHVFSTSSDTGIYEDMSQRSGFATASYNSQSDHPISAKGRSANVLQKAKSGRKSQADHSSKVNIMPEELNFVESPKKSKGRTTERGQSNTGCRVSPRKKSGTSFQTPCTNLSRPSSRKSAVGCQTDLLSEGVNNSTHAYNLRSKKPCNFQANMSPGDVSLTSSLRNLNINSRAPHLLSPQSNLAPVHSGLTLPHSSLASEHSNFTSPCSDLTSPHSNSEQSNVISPCTSLTTPHTIVKSPCFKSTSQRCVLAAPRSNLKSPRSKLASLSSNQMTFPPSNLKSPRSNLASLQSKLMSPNSNLTPSCTNLTPSCTILTSSNSSLTSSRTKSPSLHTSMPSLPTDLASPCSKSASSCSKVASPPSILALSHFKLASPATKLTSSPSNLAASLSKPKPSNLTFSCSNNAPSHSNVESPVMFTPSGFSTSSSSSLECLPFSIPYEYSNSPAPSSISTLSRSNLTTHHSSVSKQHDTNEGLIVNALPESSNGYVENLVKCGLYVESPNYVQKGVQTEPQCQSTNFRNICTCFHQFLLSHGYNQDKWASPRCENATDQCSQISAHGRLKRKASCSFTSGYFTDFSASPKRLQTCSAVRLDDDQFTNITFTRPSFKNLPEPACRIQQQPHQGHIQQQPHLPEFCGLHRSEKTASQMEESNRTSCHQISGHDFSRTHENAARRFAVAKKQRYLGSCQFANPGSSNQQPGKDNWYCLRHCAAREDYSCRPPSRTNNRVCDQNSHSCRPPSRTNNRVCDQNSHDVSVQVPPHVGDSRVCEWINASRGATNLRNNPVRHTSCFPRMQQIQLRHCSPGQLAASEISSHVASLQHVEEASTFQAPFYLQSNHHGNPQTGFKDRIRQSTEYKNHASSCHLCANKACGGACNPCDKVVHSSMESQVHAVWKEIQAERLGARTRSRNMDGCQNKSCGLGSSERLWSESKDSGGRVDKSIHPKVKTSGGQTSRHQVLKISTFFNNSLSITAGELPSFAENHSPSPKFKVPKTPPSKLKVNPQNSMFPESFIEQFSPLNPVRKDSDNSVGDDQRKMCSVQPGLKTSGNSNPRALSKKKSVVVGGNSIEQDGQINHSIDCQSEASYASWQSISSKPQKASCSSASAMSETYSLPCNRSSNQSNFGSAANLRHNYKQRDCEATSKQVSLKSLDNRASTPIRIAPRLTNFCLDDTISTIFPADNAETVGELNDNKNTASHQVTQSETFDGDSDSFEEVDLLN